MGIKGFFFNIGVMSVLSCIIFIVIKYVFMWLFKQVCKNFSDFGASVIASTMRAGVKSVKNKVRGAGNKLGMDSLKNAADGLERTENALDKVSKFYADEANLGNKYKASAYKDALKGARNFKDFKAKAEANKAFYEEGHKEDVKKSKKGFKKEAISGLKDALKYGNAKAVASEGWNKIKKNAPGFIKDKYSSIKTMASDLFNRHTESAVADAESIPVAASQDIGANLGVNGVSVDDNVQSTDKGSLYKTGLNDGNPVQSNIAMAVAGLLGLTPVIDKNKDIFYKATGEEQMGKLDEAKKRIGQMIKLEDTNNEGGGITGNAMEESRFGENLSYDVQKRKVLGEGLSSGTISKYVSQLTNNNFTRGKDYDISNEDGITYLDSLGDVHLEDLESSFSNKKIGMIGGLVNAVHDADGEVANSISEYNSNKSVKDKLIKNVDYTEDSDDFIQFKTPKCKEFLEYSGTETGNYSKLGDVQGAFIADDSVGKVRALGIAPDIVDGKHFVNSTQDGAVEKHNSDVMNKNYTEDAQDVTVKLASGAEAQWKHIGCKLSKEEVCKFDNYLEDEGLDDMVSVTTSSIEYNPSCEDVVNGMLRTKNLIDTKQVYSGVGDVQGEIVENGSLDKVQSLGITPEIVNGSAYVNKTQGEVISKYNSGISSTDYVSSAQDCTISDSSGSSHDAKRVSTALSNEEVTDFNSYLRKEGLNDSIEVDNDGIQYESSYGSVVNKMLQERDMIQTEKLYSNGVVDSLRDTGYLQDSSAEVVNGALYCTDQDLTKRLVTGRYNVGDYKTCLPDASVVTVSPGNGNLDDATAVVSDSYSNTQVLENGNLQFTTGEFNEDSIDNLDKKFYDRTQVKVGSMPISSTAVLASVSDEQRGIITSSLGDIAEFTNDGRIVLNKGSISDYKNIVKTLPNDVKENLQNVEFSKSQVLYSDSANRLKAVKDSGLVGDTFSNSFVVSDKGVSEETSASVIGRVINGSYSYIGCRKTGSNYVLKMNKNQYANIAEEGLLADISHGTYDSSRCEYSIPKDTFNEVFDGNADNLYKRVVAMNELSGEYVVRNFSGNKYILDDLDPFLESGEAKYENFNLSLYSLKALQAYRDSQAKLSADIAEKCIKAGLLYKDNVESTPFNTSDVLDEEDREGKCSRIVIAVDDRASKDLDYLFTVCKKIKQIKVLQSVIRDTDVYLQDGTNSICIETAFDSAHIIEEYLKNNLRSLLECSLLYEGGKLKYLVKYHLDNYDDTDYDIVDDVTEDPNISDVLYNLTRTCSVVAVNSKVYCDSKFSAEYVIDFEGRLFVKNPGTGKMEETTYKNLGLRNPSASFEPCTDGSVSEVVPSGTIKPVNTTALFYKNIVSKDELEKDRAFTLIDSMSDYEKFKLIQAAEIVVFKSIDESGVLDNLYKAHIPDSKTMQEVMAESILANKEYSESLDPSIRNVESIIEFMEASKNTQSLIKQGINTPELALKLVLNLTGEDLTSEDGRAKYELALDLARVIIEKSNHPINANPFKKKADKNTQDNEEERVDN